MPRGKSDYSTVKRPAYLSLADIAYNALIEAIINQEFAPGSPVSIDSLARQLNMSNTPVREALMRVNGEGLVAQKTNRGFVVADILTSQQMHQLFDVRHTLELHALSGVVVSRKDIETLQGLLEEMSKSKDGAVYSDYKDYLQHDNQFHRSLVSLSGNQFLLKAWEDLHVHLHLSRLYTGVGLFDRGDSNTEHQAIVDALQQNDNLQVLSLISQHIKRVSKRMETFLAG